MLLRRTGGHLSVANSAALARAGFDATTPDPPGGTIERAGGELSGVLTENAADIVAALIPPPSPAETIAAIRKVADECLGFGIVAAVEAAVGFNNGFEVEWDIWQALKGAGGLPLRMGFMLRIDPADARRLGLRPTDVRRSLAGAHAEILRRRDHRRAHRRVHRRPMPIAPPAGCLMERTADLRAKVIEAHRHRLAGRSACDRRPRHCALAGLP